MSWNYRIVKNSSGQEDCYAIHEAYYKRRKKPHSISQDPIPAEGETKEEVIEELKMMLHDAEKYDVLNYEDF